MGRTLKRPVISGQAVLVGGLTERGHGAALAAGPGGQDEVVVHVADEAHGTVAAVVGERELELADEGGRGRVFRKRYCIAGGGAGATSAPWSGRSTGLRRVVLSAGVGVTSSAGLSWPETGGGART